MCGRFALGLQADDIPPALNNQYFGQHQQHGHQNEEDGGDDVGGDEDAEGAQQDEQQQQPRAGPSGQGRGGFGGQQRSSNEQVGEEAVNGPVSWASFESKTGYRVRYNVRVCFFPAFPEARRGVADPFFPSSTSSLPPFAMQVCPKSRSVVLRKSDKPGQYQLDLLLWGLVPS